MSKTVNVLRYRPFILILAVLSMLFAGIIYAWSILKAPFAENFGWTASQLALNFTLTMCFFCIGGLIGSVISRKIGVKLSVFIAAALSGVGMFLTSFLNGDAVIFLYFTYAVMAGLGIGIAYNVIISAVNLWFPDKKGLCSGALMMGFGASSLVLGNISDLLFKTNMGWQGTYRLMGGALFAVLFVVGIFLKRPDADTVFPENKKSAKLNAESFETVDYTPLQMLKRFTFWRGFALIAFVTAVGNSVISFAKDLSLSVGAQTALATSLVGILAVCNGLGRIISGTLFDLLGRKRTMLIAVVLTIAAAGITLISVITANLPLCIIGLCLTGLSYGTCPTMVVAFTSAFYGSKHFSSNFAIMNCNLICASFMATACSNLIESFGGYTAPFILLLILAAVALLLNLSIKRP